MRNPDLRSLIGLIFLALGVFFLREDSSSVTGYIVSSILVVVFWYLNGLNFAISNLRNILILTLIFGGAMFAVQLVFPTNEDSAKMGLTVNGDLNPATIARLKESHNVALELYFDHRPSTEERYYKTGHLPFTDDGIHYTSQKKELNPSQFPQAVDWAKANLNSGLLDQDIEKMRAWLTNSFSYTLNPGSLRSPHPLDEFLFESRKGFCEHYAASFATLLKLRGNQARVIVGYAGGRWNPLFRILTYEDADAHAWVEVLDPATQKWSIVDPTDWIMPHETEGQSHSILFWILGLSLFSVLIAVLFFRTKRIEGVEIFIDQLNTLERKHRLESTGLTLSERVWRAADIYPERAEAMQASLSIYITSHFASEPNPTERKKLVKSISGWGKL